MNNKIGIKKTAGVFFLNMVLIVFSPHLCAGMKHEPMITMVSVDHLEMRDAVQGDTEKGNTFLLGMQVSIGNDLNKLLFKVDADRVDGELEHAELQALYTKAVTSYWDLQLGLRKDFEPDPSRNWAVLGVKGLAPYFFEIDSALFIAEEGRAGLRFAVEYELLFTQKLILSPQLTFNVYAKDDLEIGLGKGLSDSEIGFRLRYEIWREFAPYVGIAAHNTYGATADYAESLGEKSHAVQFLAGLKFWY